MAHISRWRFALWFDFFRFRKQVLLQFFLRPAMNRIQIQQKFLHHKRYSLSTEMCFIRANVDIGLHVETVGLILILLYLADHLGYHPPNSTEQCTEIHTMNTQNLTVY